MTDEHPILLTDQPAGPAEHRAALAVVLVSTAAFLATAPFAQVPLTPLPAFIPIYESALIINDLITAVFLFAHFNISRSQALLVLACGYLFTASLAVLHLLTFPGLFSPGGLLGAGPQSTAWLYMFWHGGFPLFVMAYAVRRDREGPSPPARTRLAALFSAAAVLVIASGFALLATAGHDALPAIMRGNHYTPVMIGVVTGTWLLSLVALIALTYGRRRSVLDLWLMVVMFAWLLDIALSAVLNAGRYDLGFYAGRIYGLLATSFVLVVLLLEKSKLYARLIALRASDRAKSAELQRLAVLDPLTGIANRRAFEEALDQEWRRTLRHKTPLSLLMIDVDYFKRFNDAYGHVAGDQCLRAVAQTLAHSARRAGEMAARYGGEEFGVLLPHADLDEAYQLAQRICQSVRDLNVPHRESAVASHVTISVGVASAPLDAISEIAGTLLLDDGTSTDIRRASPTILVKTADGALYRAKTDGRNRAVAAYAHDLATDMPADTIAHNTQKAA